MSRLALAVNNLNEGTLKEMIPEETKPGLKWQKVGVQKPEKGTEIKNQALAMALQKPKQNNFEDKLYYSSIKLKEKVGFCEVELNDFRIGKLSYDSYIKVETGEYFVLADCQRIEAMANSLRRLKTKFVQERLHGKHLHEHKEWRSALEVVVQNEVAGKFLQENEEGDEDKENANTIFQELVAEKWDEFGCRYHLVWNVAVHVLVLALYMMLLIMRVPVLYQNRFGVDFDGWAVVSSHEQQVRVLKWYYPFVIGVSIPILCFKAWQESRLTALDLDPNEDQDLSFYEVIIFAYKNLGTLLNSSAAAAMFVQVLAVRQARDISELRASPGSEIFQETLGFLNEECETMAFIVLILWCKLLHLLVPFKLAGSMLIIVWYGPCAWLLRVCAHGRLCVCARTWLRGWCAGMRTWPLGGACFHFSVLPSRLLACAFPLAPSLNKKNKNK